MTGDRPPSAVADARARLLRSRVETGERWIDVEGRSMLPTIAPPARVLVEAAPAPSIGEVWVFVGDQGDILAHRYIRRVGDRLRFKGDGNTEVDGLVDPGRLVGRVVRAEDPRGERPVPRQRWRALAANLGFGIRRRYVRWRR